MVMRNILYFEMFDQLLRRCNDMYLLETQLFQVLGNIVLRFQCHWVHLGFVHHTYSCFWSLRARVVYFHYLFSVVISALTPF